MLQLLMLKTTNQARTLVVVMDSVLNFNSNIKKITKSAFCHPLRNMSRIKGLMSQHEKPDHECIYRGLDYFNGLFTCFPEKKNQSDSCNRLRFSTLLL